MPIDITSKIKPKNNGQFPVCEDIDIEGGFQIRKDLNDRNNIPILNRKIGMLVFVQSENKYYILESNIDNNSWKEILLNRNKISDLRDFNLIEISDEFILASSKTYILPTNPIDGEKHTIIDCEGISDISSIKISDSNNILFELSNKFKSITIIYSSIMNKWYEI